jgi:hypothetical protein
MAAKTRGRPPAGTASKKSALTSEDHRQRSAGETARDDGAAGALGAAWAIWRLAAREQLEALAGAGREFCADDLVEAVGLPPVTGSPNAVGGTFIAAINAGLIVPVAYTRSRRRSRHAGVQRVYRGARP